MNSDHAARRLHHDLRDALSAVNMNLQTLAALEAGDHAVDSEKRLSILERAKQALAEAVEVADRIRSESAQPRGHARS